MNESSSHELPSPSAEFGDSGSSSFDLGSFDRGVRNRALIAEMLSKAVNDGESLMTESGEVTSLCFPGVEIPPKIDSSFPLSVRTLSSSSLEAITTSFLLRITLISVVLSSTRLLLDTPSKESFVALNTSLERSLSTCSCSLKSIHKLSTSLFSTSPALSLFRFCLAALRPVTIFDVKNALGSSSASPSSTPIIHVEHSENAEKNPLSSSISSRAILSAPE
mmetsp:Transcript_14197/g.25226  ORF Transcript_14197/g.25226 Transcript_14197/m.25226 type:complete len:221 (+) Transcript_14197:4579-5241(+)